mgnify:CR=1 FL=1|jgi:hypothetical protein
MNLKHFDPGIDVSVLKKEGDSPVVGLIALMRAAATLAAGTGPGNHYHTPVLPSVGQHDRCMHRYEPLSRTL